MGFPRGLIGIFFWISIVSGFAGLFIDAAFSIAWFRYIIPNVAKSYPFIPTVLALIVCVIIAGFGAASTYPPIYDSAIMGAEDLAKITDDLRRSFYIAGIFITCTILILGVGSFILIDVLSNYYQIGNYFLVAVVILIPTISFYIANVLWEIHRRSKLRTR